MLSLSDSSLAREAIIKELINPLKYITQFANRLIMDVDENKLP
ncbi:UNVERIFIED_ORG: hypothetical protein J2Y78_004941 [Buttiauxella agrestis ATCC 33320]